MPRAKRGFKRRRRVNKVRSRSEGFFIGLRNQYRRTVEAVQWSLVYGYRDRRRKKREFRQLWIARINAAAVQNGISYSRLVNALKKSNVELDRKSLSEVAIHDPSAFSQIVDSVRAAAPKV